MLSLEFVLGFCHEIAKMGDCKVEFNEPSCWFYSMPNLLVFWKLVTLYLGGNHVRVVCERVWRNAQDCAKKQGLITGSRRWLATCKPPEVAHVPSMPKVETSCQLEHYRTKSIDWPFIYLAAWTHGSVKSWGQATSQFCFEKNWLFAFLSHPSIYNPYTHEI